MFNDLENPFIILNGRQCSSTKTKMFYLPFLYTEISQLLKINPSVNELRANKLKLEIAT